jgi:Tol biopolymer transport system component
MARASVVDRLPAASYAGHAIAVCSRHTRGRILLPVGVALIVAAAVAPLAVAAKDETTLISRQSAAAGGASGDDDADGASISADGRYVAFLSLAGNLTADPVGVNTDVFVRDTLTDTTTLASRQSAAAGGAPQDNFSTTFNAAISAGGRHVAFDSGALNLSDDDADNFIDVFVRDTQTSTTTQVSRESAADGGQTAQGSSDDPSISANGRYVAFESDAANLSDADTNLTDDIFVRDTQTHSTTLVSRRSASGGGAGADDDSTDPSISANGRYVAFRSGADNLSGADDNTFINAFVRDTMTNTTTLVSRQSAADGGAGAGGSAFEPSISADGRYVAFRSGAFNLSAADNDAFFDVFVRDTLTNTTTLVSRQSAANGAVGADEDSFLPSISANGRYVAFESDADNLSGADDNSFRNVFVRDTLTNTTTFVSRQTAADGGAGGDGDSRAPAISAAGRYVAFDSDADNLSALDADGISDVFLRDVLGAVGPPSPAPDTTPPNLDLSAKKRQRLGKPVKVKASCDEACSVVAKGKVKPRKLKRAEAELAAGETEKLKLRPSKRVARRLKRLDRAKARITATATDAAGNASTAKLKVKLR